MFSFDKNDLRGIVTIVVLLIFAFCIFVPVLAQIYLDKQVVIPDAFAQATIQLAIGVVMFYFGNKATRDKMEQ